MFTHFTELHTSAVLLDTAPILQPCPTNLNFSMRWFLYWPMGVYQHVQFTNVTKNFNVMMQIKLPVN